MKNEKKQFTFKALKGEHPTMSEIIQKEKNDQVFSTSFVTLTKNCENKCKMCFTEKKRETCTEETPKELNDKMINLTKEMGGEAIRIVGLGEPLLDKNLDSILDSAKEKNLQVVLFTNAIKLTENKLKELKARGNVSLMTKLWGDPETTAFMTGNDWYNKEENITEHNTDFGKIKVPKYIDLIINSGFPEIDGNSTNFGLEFMVTEKNIDQLPVCLAFMIENNISPYIRTPFPVNATDNIDLDIRGVDLPSKEQFDEVNIKIKEMMKHYGITNQSFRQGSKTKHCMRTVYNFVFENIDGKVFAKPCHHLTAPTLEIVSGTTVEQLKSEFFAKYKTTRESIVEAKSEESKDLDLHEVMDGCVCAARFKQIEK